MYYKYFYDIYAWFPPAEQVLRLKLISNSTWKPISFRALITGLTAARQECVSNRKKVCWIGKEIKKMEINAMYEEQMNQTKLL